MSVQCKGEPLLAPADRRGGAASYPDGCCDGNGFSLSRPVSGASSSSPSMAVVGAERDVCLVATAVEAPPPGLACSLRSSERVHSLHWHELSSRRRAAGPGPDRIGAHRGQPACVPAVVAWCLRARLARSIVSRCRQSWHSGPGMAGSLGVQAALPASTPPQQEAGGAHR